MKTIVGAVIVMFLLAQFAYGAAPSIWAINVGNVWAPSEKSCIINSDTFNVTQTVYPLNGLPVLEDAAYVPSTSTLYVSGSLLSPYWYSSAVAVYQGGPQGLSLVSLSDTGMEGCNWLAGIEYIGGNLYGIAITEWGSGNNFLARINNPGMPSQSVTQIGPYLGAVGQMGAPYALCKDDNGGLIASFGDSDISSLYSVNISTGIAVPLHTYGYGYLNGEIEGLAMVNNRLFAVVVNGNVYEINLGTYEATELGNLGEHVWTALVTIPEPSIIMILCTGIVLFFKCKSKNKKGTIC